MTIRELTPPEAELEPDEQYTMFHPSEVELSETTQTILADVERLKPTRVVFDSLSELRLLAGNPLRYRRQILALKQFFAGRDCTVLLLDDMTGTDHDLQVQSIAHGVCGWSSCNPEYGAERRRLRVVKYRGMQLPRRLPRLHDRARRPRGLPAAGRRRAPRSASRDEARRAASPSSTRCSAAASSGAPAR